MRRPQFAAFVLTTPPIPLTSTLVPHSNRADENAAGESLWEPPYADEGGEGGELVNGRRLKAGWRKVGPDDDGDIWYENAAGER